jgi:elongation factor G
MTIGSARAHRALVALASPDSVIGAAVSSSGARTSQLSALTKALERPVAPRHPCQETGETLMEGQGEMHLRVTLERLTGKYGISIKTHEPAVPYKETIKGATTVRGRHKKQSGGHGQFGDVVLEIRPVPRGSGFRFTDSITGGVVPKNYISAVEEGVTEYLARGPLGFPIVDISVKLTDGSYHAVDSSDMAFRTAAQIGMREGMAECKPVLLEPVRKVEMRPSDTARVNASSRSAAASFLVSMRGRAGRAGTSSRR